MHSSFPHEAAIHYVTVNDSIMLQAELIHAISKMGGINNEAGIESETLRAWMMGRPAYPDNDPPNGRFINILKKK